MHTLKLKLHMTKSQRHLADRRFAMLWRVHNQTARHATKRLHALRHGREYRQLLEEYRTLDGKQGARKKEISARLIELREEAGLTKQDLEKYASVMQKEFSRHLSSHQVQKEADRVWAAVEKVLFGNGKMVHFKKLDEMRTISTKSENGCHYTDRKHPSNFERDEILWPDGQVVWMGETIRVDIDWEDPYVSASLSGKLKYCEIAREPYRNGWHYFVILYLEDPPPQKHALGKGMAGLDGGVSAMCACTNEEIIFEELAPECKSYNKEIATLQALIDRSMRANNPENYNPDGTVKKGKHKWKVSRSCRKLKWRLKDAYRRKKAYTANTQNVLANKIVSQCDTLIVEDMKYRALAKRSKKKAERSEKESTIKKKDGTVLKVRKFKKKKRFGKSVTDRSPGGFLAVLKHKMEALGGTYEAIDPKVLKASRYRHDTNTFENVPLSKRSKVIAGKKVYRDPYSAFLLKNINDERTSVNRRKCGRNFKRFLELQDEMVQYVNEHHPQHPSCFGF